MPQKDSFSHRKIILGKKTHSRVPPFRKLCRLAEQELDNTCHQLPLPLQEALAKLSIHLEYFPSVEWLKRGITPDQLGLFEGVGAEDPMSYQIPRITLWLGNLWLVANGDIPAFLEEVRITFLHEVGHYLGLDENQLTDRDLY